jgi:hypothetical protein
MQKQQSVQEILRGLQYFDCHSEQELSYRTVLEKSGDFLCLFFGAYHLPGSLAFGRDYLTTFYHQVNAHQKQVEIVYVSADRTFKEFKAHVKDMPWVTLPHTCPDALKLKKLLNVTDVPRVIFLEVYTSSLPRSMSHQASMNFMFGYGEDRAPS